MCIWPKPSQFWRVMFMCMCNCVPVHPVVRQLICRCYCIWHTIPSDKQYMTHRKRIPISEAKCRELHFWFMLPITSQKLIMRYLNRETLTLKLELSLVMHMVWASSKPNSYSNCVNLFVIRAIVGHASIYNVECFDGYCNDENVNNYSSSYNM